LGPSGVDDGLELSVGAGDELDRDMRRVTMTNAPGRVKDEPPRNMPRARATAAKRGVDERTRPRAANDACSGEWESVAAEIMRPVDERPFSRQINHGQ
jgi:hypothetical protein